MSETFEISDTTPTAHSVVSENGKNCYYLNVQRSTPSKLLNESRVFRTPHDLPQTTAEIFESGPLVYEEQIKIPPQPEKSGPIHYYGESMVVKNAREMFNNVDILSDGRYFCCVCKRPYKTHATLTAHLRGSHLRQESPCKEEGCNYVSMTENERRKHQKQHDKTKYSKYSNNNVLTHEKMEDIIKPLFPPENVHREQVVHNCKEIVGMDSALDKRGKTIWSCKQCDDTFQNAYYARRHMEFHSNVQRHCFYCGEKRKSVMDLRVHYMRFHKNEGVRTYTCKSCERTFTTMALFRNHATQAECELACRKGSVRHDFVYGELPDGTTIDNVTLTRMNFYRKSHEERQHMDSVLSGTEEGGASSEETVQPILEPYSGDEAGASTSSSKQYSDIFNGSNSMIQTEFGLKSFADFKTTRAEKRVVDEDDSHQQFTNIKKERVLMAQNGYYHHQQHPLTTQSQQQNISWQTNVYPPPSYSYDPLIGRYPDFFQPMQQQAPSFDYHQQIPHYNSATYYQHEPTQLNEIPAVVKEEVVNEVAQKTVDYGSYQLQDDQLGNTSDIASDLLINGPQDIVFEELNKLDFVMPTNTENDNDDDLEGMFNF